MRRAKYVASHYDHRYQDLGKDPAHGGNVSDKTLRESGVGLALEGRGQLPKPIKRFPTAAAEFLDDTGQAWDVKTFNSSYRNGFEVNRATRQIKDEIAKGENIIVDTKDMSPAHIQELRESIQKEGLTNNVLWYP